MKKKPDSKNKLSKKQSLRRTVARALLTLLFTGITLIALRAWYWNVYSWAPYSPNCRALYNAVKISIPREWVVQGEKQYDVDEIYMYSDDSSLNCTVFITKGSKIPEKMNDETKMPTYIAISSRSESFYKKEEDLLVRLKDDYERKGISRSPHLISLNNRHYIEESQEKYWKRWTTRHNQYLVSVEAHIGEADRNNNTQTLIYADKLLDKLKYQDDSKRFENIPTIPDGKRKVEIGNFIFHIPSSMNPITCAGCEFSTQALKTGKFSDDYEYEDHIKNINAYSFSYYSPQVKYEAPGINIYSWNMNEITGTQVGMENFIGWVGKLNHLEKYTSHEALKNVVYLNTYARNLYPGSREPDVYLTRFVSWGGIFSFPLEIIRLETDRFDQAYFVAVTEGNGDVWLPHRLLVLNKNDDWIFLSAPRSDIVSQDEYDKLDQCFREKLKDDPRINMPLKCVSDVWWQYFHDETEERAWANQMMDAIQYVNSK